ncbi:hypothetical protein V8C26DRAFT_396641 [Trichoderma gracile]
MYGLIHRIRLFTLSHLTCLFLRAFGASNVLSPAGLTRALASRRYPAAHQTQASPDPLCLCLGPQAVATVWARERGLSDQTTTSRY